MNENSTGKKSILKKWWFWCILVLLVIAIILVIVFIPKNESGDNLVLQTIGDLMLPEFNKTAMVNETVLYEQNNVKITLRGLSYDSYGVNVNLEFENNTSEELEFIAGSTGLCKNSINEFMMKDGYIYTEVEDGQTEIDSIDFSYDSLSLYGIDEIAEIILTFDISASDYDSNFQEFQTEPLKIKTSLYDSYNFNNDSRYIDRITSNAIKSIYNSKILQKDTTKNSIADKLDIISMVRMENKDNEEIMMLEIKNDSEKDIKVKISDVKFNDKMVYDYSVGTDDIINNKKGILDIDISNLKDKDEAKDIKSIEKISFMVSVLDSNYREILSREISYTINPTITIISNTNTEENTTILSETTNSVNEFSNNSTAASSKEFKEAMDSYEEFMNEYVEFMKKYNANPTDSTLLSQYATMLQKYSEQISAFNKWESEDMTTEDANYYVDVQARVTKKLLEVAQ